MNNSNEGPLWELAGEQVDSRLEKTRRAAREAASKAARELDQFDYEVEMNLSTSQIQQGCDALDEGRLFAGFGLGLLGTLHGLATIASHPLAAIHDASTSEPDATTTEVKMAESFVDFGIETMEPDSDDALLMRAIQVIVKDRRTTTTYLQRSLRIGYNRAATMIEELENRGIIGPAIGTVPRRIMIESIEEAIAKCKEGGGE